MSKSPISWYGGKYYMANKIIELFPEHKTFVEVFGGAGHIIFKKQKSQIEIYNDMHEGLYLFFKYLRDNELRDNLIGNIQLTPYSRQEFDESKDWMNEDNEFEKVRKFYVRTMQAVGGNGGWSYTKSKSRRGMSQAVSRWLGNVENNLIDVIERLTELQIERLDYKKCIEKYDNTDTFFYMDPPYFPDTRNMNKGYQHEMTISEHEELIDLLKRIEGKVILSGYQNNVYNKLKDHGWMEVELGEFAKRSMKNNDGKLDKGSEIVWINF
jgi:DNA adenine methylase